MHDHIEITEEERDSGFTLVELLIVIVILGILAAVTVFAVGGITDTAETNSCNISLKSLDTAAEVMKAETGAYPANAAALETAGYIQSADLPSGCAWTAPT